MTLPESMLTKAWIGACELADAIGIPRRTMQRWCLDGRIPASKRGPKLWFVNLRKLREDRESAINELILEAQVEELRRAG